MNTAIIGLGWVGKAMQQLFPHSLIYSPSYEFSRPKEEINQCDIVFICVPTPPMKNGRLNTFIIDDTIAWLKVPLIVVRSTVNPGFCGEWDDPKNGRRILFQPEYLGETPNHPLLDTKKTPFLIIGGERVEDRKKLIDLYGTVYNANVKIRQVTLLEAEIIKLTENRAIAFKVAQCQELYDACEKAGVDYYTIRDAVYGDDPRFNLWWTFVYPEERGFDSKCIPKDVYAWCAWTESLGYKPEITRAILERNKKWIKKESISQ